MGIGRGKSTIYILQETFQLYRLSSVTYISNKISNWRLNDS